MKNIVLFYIPCPSEEEAKKLAQMLLEQRLVACSNLFPIQSMFWWQEKIEKADEWVVLAKTLEIKADAVCRVVKENHPYQTPCIIKMAAQATDDFVVWMVNVLS